MLNVKTAHDPRSKMDICDANCPRYHVARIDIMTARTQSEKI